MSYSSKNPKFEIIYSLEQAGDPATPPTSNWGLYTKSAGWYQIDDTGAVLKLVTGGDIAAEQSLGSITWDGTPPSGTISALYLWRRVNGMVVLSVRYTATVAGTANTTATFALPGDVPTPIGWTGWGTSEQGYLGVGLIGASEGTTSTQQGYMSIQKDGSSNLELFIRSPSTNAVYFGGTIVFPCA